MDPINITCYKGTATAQDFRVYQFDPSTFLTAVRTRLTTDGFLPADDTANNVAYRFVAAQSESSNMEEALINKSVEYLLPVAGVLGGANQLITTNYLATTKPDLIGIGTDWFFDRNVGVNISLNTGDPEAVATNSSIGAFPPLMLTNVKPTSSNVVGIYDNVCVCVENSVVNFSISSWGAAGFQYYIAPESGEPICDGDLNICFGDNPNRRGNAFLSRYYGKSQTIQIVGAASQNISGGAETLRFQKVTVKTRRITSYDQNGTTFASNQAPPTPSGPASADVFHARVADAAADLDSQKSLVKAPTITTVPGDSIKPGGTVEGPASQQQFGSPISNIQTDDWSQALGEVVIYFFVFKSFEQANRVINDYNVPDPTLWS
jgi:hypothetical protein